MGATLCSFHGGDTGTFTRLLVGGDLRQDGRQRLCEGTADIGLEDNLEVFNPLEFAKLHNGPTGSVGSRTKKSKTD